MQMLPAAYDVIDTSPLPSFPILLSNVSLKAMHFPEKIAVEYATDQQAAVMTRQSSPNQLPLMRTSEREYESMQSDVNFAGSHTAIAHDKEKDVRNNVVAEVQYKHLVYRASQV